MKWKRGDRFTHEGREGVVVAGEDTDWNPQDWRWCRHVLVRYDGDRRLMPIFDERIDAMERVE